jgi:alpha-L-fucosidase 2
MLLQTHTRQEGKRVLHLLPALPDAWTEGSVTGLRARGGFEVDIAWEKGRLKSATLRNLAGDATVLVRVGTETRLIHLEKAQSYQWK